MPTSTKPIDQNIKETAQNMLLSGLSPGQVALKLGLKRSTVCNWQRGQPKSLKQMREMVQTVTRAELPKLAESRLSQIVRSRLSNEAAAQAKALAESSSSITVSDLATKDGVQGRAAILKTVVDASKELFGWTESEAGMIGLNDLDALEVIDVESATTMGSGVTDTPESEPSK